ncbi:hypothetical protein [Sulfitobacter sp. SK012]|nr:hypothetical protein [Sulfitobacter sp. SK012]
MTDQHYRLFPTKSGQFEQFKRPSDPRLLASFTALNNPQIMGLIFQTYL